MTLGKPAPCVSAFLDAVDEAMRAHHPHHGMSAIPRAWLAFCVTAVLVTNSICWARVERARLGTYSLAALVGDVVGHRKIPWDALLVGPVVRVILPQLWPDLWQPSSVTIPIINAQKQPKRSPICPNAAIKTVAAMSGGKA